MFGYVVLLKGRTTGPAASVACPNGVDVPVEMREDDVETGNGAMKFMLTCPPPTADPVPSIRSTEKGGGGAFEGVSAVTSCLLLDAICCWRNSDVANCFMAEFYKRET